MWCRVGLVGLLTLVSWQGKIGLRLYGSAAGGQTIITEGDLTLTSLFRVDTAMTEASHSDPGITGRQVGGDTHLFIYGDSSTRCAIEITGGTSTTVFAVASTSSGCDGGTSLAVNDYITVRRAAQTFGALDESVKITNITSLTLTVTPALGGTPANHDAIFRAASHVWELTVPSGGYSTTLASAPRLTNATNWGDVYRGRVASWNVGTGALVYPLSTPVNIGMFWSETNQLLYWSYYDSYNTNGDPIWGLGATDLTASPSTLVAYGPWRTKATDSDGNDWYGAFRCGAMGSRPNDDTQMICMGYQGSGNHTTEWGPAYWSGLAFPTQSTPSGYGQADLVLADRYMEHYYMANAALADHFTIEGALVGNIRSLDYTMMPATYGYIFEPHYQTVGLRGDPDLGNASASEIDIWEGILHTTFTHKKGVLYAATLRAAPSGNASSCATGSHEVYTNAGQYTSDMTNTAGSYVAGHVITGSPSGASGSVVGWDGTNRVLTFSQTGPEQATPFLEGDTITDSNGKTAVGSPLRRHDKCYHVCTMWPNTGPTWNTANAVSQFPALLIYDPDTLDAAKNTANDYPEPTSIIDLRDFNSAFAGINEGDTADIAGFYQEPSGAKRIFMLARAADNTAPFNLSLAPVVYMFTVNDAPPAPVWPMAMAVPAALSAIMLLFRRRTA